MADLFDPFGFYAKALFLIKRAFYFVHVKYDTRLFAIDGERLIILDGPIGSDIDNHIVFQRRGRYGF